MPKIEIAIKDAIRRGAGRQIRQATTPLRREVRRLRRIVASLRKDLIALKATAILWERSAQQTPWSATVSEEAAKAARLSPRLIQKLRARLGVSQAALGRLVGAHRGVGGAMGTRPRLTRRRAAKGCDRTPGAWSPGGEASAGGDAEAAGEASPASRSVRSAPPSPTEHANTANRKAGIGQVRCSASNPYTLSFIKPRSEPGRSSPRPAGSLVQHPGRLSSPPTGAIRPSPSL